MAAVFTYADRPLMAEPGSKGPSKAWLSVSARPSGSVGSGSSMIWKMVLSAI